MDQPVPEGASKRGRRIPPWVTFLGILALAVVLLFLVVCVVIPVLANLFSPSTTNLAAQALLESGCQQQNPNLLGDRCSGWAAGVSGSDSTALEGCRAKLDGTDSARDPVAWYRCMIDQGVDPPH
jgi:hypothetical protein